MDRTQILKTFARINLYYDVGAPTNFELLEQLFENFTRRIRLVGTLIPDLDSIMDRLPYFLGRLYRSFNILVL